MDELAKVVESCTMDRMDLGGFAGSRVLASRATREYFG
jgi:hypothetical protein